MSRIANDGVDDHALVFVFGKLFSNGIQSVFRVLIVYVIEVPRSNISCGSSLDNVEDSQVLAPTIQLECRCDSLIGQVRVNDGNKDLFVFKSGHCIFQLLQRNFGKRLL